MTDNTPPGGSDQKPLEFVNVSNPFQREDEDTRRQIRSAAASGPRRRNRSGRLRRGEFVLDITPLLSAPSASYGREQQYEDGVEPSTTRTWTGYDGTSEPGSRFQRQWETSCASSSNLNTMLSASYLDPFSRYPFPMESRDRELYDHILDGSCIIFRTIRDIGFLAQIRESAGFLQLICASCWHLAHLRNIDGRAEHLSYTTRAMNTLRKRIQDPLQCTGDEVVGAVLAFVCFANLTHNTETMRIHFTGLLDIIRRRGGVATLESNPAFRIMLFWADVNGAYLQDTQPFFTPPYHLIARHNNLPPFPLRDSDYLSLYDDPIVKRICCDLRRIHLKIRSELSKRSLWNDTLFPSYQMLPLLHGLLAQPRLRSVLNNAEVRIECFRLAVIIYLGELRGKFTIDNSIASMYAEKLKILLGEEISDWGDENIYLLWILTVGSVSLSLSAEDRHWFLSRMGYVASLAGIFSLEELRNAITSFLWCDEALGDQWEYIREGFIATI